MFFDGMLPSRLHVKGTSHVMIYEPSISLYGPHLRESECNSLNNYKKKILLIGVRFGLGNWLFCVFVIGRILFNYN